MPSNSNTLTPHYQPQHYYSLLDEHPDTLLTIQEAAVFLRKKPKTIAVDVTRKPQSLPTITRMSGRILFSVRDILLHIRAHRSVATVVTPTPTVNRARGRPRKMPASKPASNAQ